MRIEFVRILLVEDNPDDTALFIQLMRSNRYRTYPEFQYSIQTVTTMKEGMELVSRGEVDAVVVDLLLRNTTPNDILALIEETSKIVPVIALTSDENIGNAISAIEHGSQDYLVKNRTSGDTIERAVRFGIERKKLIEEQQHIKEELIRSNEELQQFAYIASHDLQEPLRMVVSYLSLLEKRNAGNLDARSKEYLDYAVDGGKRMKIMIDDLLAYSRAATIAKEFVQVDMNDALATALKDLRASIEQSRASVTHDALPTVMADQTQIVLLLENLISNAIKFRGLAAPQIHVSARGGRRGMGLLCQ